MGRTITGIEGERFPRIGDTMTYKVIFDASVNSAEIKDEDIKWQLYWANEFSEYTEVDFSKLKTGKQPTYKFLNNLANKNLQLKVSYKNEKAELHIVPTLGESKIIDIFFLNNEYKALDKVPSYGQGIVLQIYTVNMKNKFVNFNIYDMVNGSDVIVGKNSQPLRIEQNNGIVKSDQIILNLGMSLQTQQDLSSESHQYKVKAWENENDSNSYEETLKVKNEQVSYTPPESQAPAKKAPDEAKPKEDKKDDDKKCFCDRDLEIEDLIGIGISKKNSEKFKDSLNETFKNYNINSCIRKLHFLAQVRHESGDFVYAEEIWGPTPTQLGYEGRKDLCNTTKGDGKRFLGRGLIQMTGRCNYTSYTNYKKQKGVDIDFTTEPNNKKMGNLPYSTDSAGWYWSEKLGLNLSDFADKDDIIYITYRINGGYNGYVEDRKPKLVNMIKKSVKCENSNYVNYDKYSIKKSKCWNLHDAVYKYAVLGTDEYKDSYKQYLSLTDDYLNFTSVKGWEETKVGSSKRKAKAKIEARREKAKQKSK